MATNKYDTTNKTDTSELLDTLKIAKIENRSIAGGTWVQGTIGNNGFEALVFPDHAVNPEYELVDSRISKLWVQRSVDRKMVANFDRGWDLRPATPIVGQIVDLLAAGLTETVFAK